MTKYFSIIFKVCVIVISFPIFVIIYSCNQNKNKNLNSKYKNVVTKSKKIDINADSDFVKIDSIKLKSNALEYRLFYYSKNKTKEVYRIKNQDHSIEFYKSYFYRPLDYVSYQINDLPTGLVWNIFYNKSSQEFYITDKYDVHAIGDTIDRKSVNFSKKFATVISTEPPKNYKLYFKKIWPK